MVRVRGTVRGMVRVTVRVRGMVRVRVMVRGMVMGMVMVTVRVTVMSPRRRKPLKRKPVRRVNRARKAREWKRAYGSKERVEYFKTLPCCLSGRVPTADDPSDNAHCVTGGAGRKGHYTEIIPLSRAMHAWFDQQSAEYRRAFLKTALLYEGQWQIFQRVSQW